MSNKLFYLEDDEALANLTIRAFHRREFLVQHSFSLAEAKLALKGCDFTHALLDMKLSDGNAMTLLTDILNCNPNIKILILTGYASIATAVQSVKLGAYNYLSKPASIEEIMSAFGDQPDISNTPANTMSLKRLEWEKIQQTLIENDGNISLTAKKLNMHRRTLQRKLNKKPVQK